ncbi:MAG: DUF1059 domain-containing protein [Thaumarchaeota archaeon]|nr:DUF1059 domain-containing protein [Nitrososphaerota archaeon]
MPTKVGCKDLGIPCDHEEEGEEVDDLLERLLRYQIVHHGRRDTPELRTKIRSSIVGMQREIGR